MGNIMNKHETEYAKYVTKLNIEYVMRQIGRERIEQSTSKYFNDIPLGEWDRLRFSSGTLSQQVCAAKACAQAIRNNYNQNRVPQ